MQCDFDYRFDKHSLSLTENDQIDRYDTSGFLLDETIMEKHDVAYQCISIRFSTRFQRNVLQSVYIKSIKIQPNDEILSLTLALHKSEYREFISYHLQATFISRDFFTLLEIA